MVASPDLQPLPYSSSGPEEILLEKYTQEKNASLQHLPSSLYPSTTHIEHEALIKGFTAITVAGAFVASIQAQVMSTTLSADPKTKALHAINAFYLVGLVLDMLSSLLAFLSTRWLERLTEAEKDLLETMFSYHNPYADEKKDLVPSLPLRPWKTGDRQWFYYTYLSVSIHSPLTLLVLGIACMLVGLCTYAWTQHPTVVACLVTLASAVPLPFVVGDFSIGKKRDKREKLIIRLSEMQGDW